MKNASSDLETVLYAAQQALQAQDYTKAEDACRQAFALTPREPRVLLLKARIFKGYGQLEAGIALLEYLVQSYPQAPIYAYTLSRFYCRNGNFTQAHHQLDTLTKKDLGTPAKTQFERAEIFRMQGQTQVAMGAYLKVLELQADHSRAANNLGLFYLDQGKPEKALGYFKICLPRQETQETQHPSQQLNRARALYQLGRLEEALNALQPLCKAPVSFYPALLERSRWAAQAGEFQAAIHNYEQALKRNPTDPEPVQELLTLLHTQAQVLPTQPDAETHITLRLQLGQRHLHQQNWHQAHQAFQQVLSLSPAHPKALFNLGNLYLKQGEIGQARAYYEQLLAKTPAFSRAQANYALALFLEQDYQAGFTAYEHRWKTLKPHRAMKHTPRWQGQLFQHQTLLVFAEPQKGFGDVLQFARYLPLVKLLGGQVILECPSPLKLLFEAQPYVDQVITPDMPLPPIDWQIPLMSLAHQFKTTRQTLPDDIPYLELPPTPARQSLPTGPKVGFVWASASFALNAETLALYRQKTCPLAHFISLMKSPEWVDIDFYSFQVGTHEAELIPHEENPRLHALSSQIDHFLDTAWLIQQMDLVISVDTAVAHVAGALGKPVYLLLPATPYWFWSPETTSSPWYPSMRIFRQAAPNDWQSVFEALKQPLKS